LDTHERAALTHERAAVLFAELGKKLQYFAAGEMGIDT